ncbi:hypothetical protein PSE_0970 [Pseudovibrio sp. FO-BEG1]|uniref:nuclear transport factor 2 family protein n=1 Tax=Pseudovibrio sp. (strain FO-BEG1) TaxID=911045 RepID=UPI000238C6B1|nr:nuclear transport factor 2 family protein [Pseudovibrio sp. FO-BEG1]AEV35482.1 hypothetical protein PSE_0970 [Pseudovibrio sp. FO-BEG1]
MDAVRKLNNAKGLYLDGIRDGKVRKAIQNYTGDRYTQHSTGIADGADGFIAFFEPFIQKNPDRDIQVIRAFSDGRFVFLHVYQDLNNGAAKWVTADIFDTDDNDRIIEHWDVIQAFAERTPSGDSMIGGSTETTDHDKTEDNKALIRAFFDKVLIDGDSEHIAAYLSKADFTDHTPQFNGEPGGLQSFAQAPTNPAESSCYRELHLLMGEGNFVATLSCLQHCEEDWARIDLFRLHQGAIVEHWAVQEKILPKEQWGNSGKF